MGKIVFWILVAVAVMLLVKQLGPARRLERRHRAGIAGGGGGDDRPGHEDGDRAPTHDVIMACSVCGVHVPASEAIFASGRVYCCEEHRDQGRAALENGQR